MLKSNLIQLLHKSTYLSKNHRNIYRWKLTHTVSMFLLGLLFIGGFLALQVKPVRAFPEWLDTTKDSENASPLSIPAFQTTTLEVRIVSSPYATLDNNKPEQEGPRVFVVQAEVTNIGSETATDVVVTLNYNEDVAAGWLLLPGEDTERTIGTLPAGESYQAYWFATYPTTAGLGHTYTVTANAANAGSVSTSQNDFENPDGQTVKTRSANSAGNSALDKTTTTIQVGIAFTMTATFELGDSPEVAIFSPVGNLDFDAGAYRLLSAKARFYNADNSQNLKTVDDRLYINDLSGVTSGITNVNAEVIYTFLALDTSNTNICPSAVVEKGATPKYDNDFCTSGSKVVVDGELTITMSKQTNRAEIEQGDVMTYTIFYANTFTKPVEGVWIWDDLPPGVSISGAITPANDPTESTDGRVVWNLGTVPAESSGTLQFAVKADGNGQDLTNGQQLVNHALLSINPGSFRDQPILTKTVTTTVQAPALAVTKTDGKETANPGESFNYTVTLNNGGAAAAQNLIVTDTLPSDLILAGATTPPFDSKNGQTLVWNNLGSINSGAGTQITIPVAVKANIPGNTDMVNTATAVYQNSFGYTYEQSGSDTTTALAGSADTTTLAVSKTAVDLDGSPLQVGDLISYTIKVTNTGTVTPANFVTVVDDLPDGVICQSVSGDTNPPSGCADPLVWTIPSLGPGQTATLEIQVLLDASSEGESIINSLEVSGSNIDDIPPGDLPEVCPDGSEPTNGTCDANGIPGPPDATTVAVTKTAQDLNGPPLAVGDTVRYTIEVENTGNEIAFDLLVTDDLPAEVLCQSVSGDNAPSGCADPLIWEIPILGVGQKATLTIDVLIKPSAAGQSIVNSVTVSGTNIGGDQVDEVCPDGSQPTGDTCDSNGVPDLVDTEISVSKTAQDLNGSPLKIGDIIRYVVQVTNDGPRAVFNVKVTDDLPNQVTCESVSGDNAPVGCADPLVWIIPILDVGQTAMLTIDVSINPGSGGQIIINSLGVEGDNIIDIPVDDLPQVCPDGSEPVNGICESTPEAPNGEDDGPPIIYLPIVKKNG